MAILKVALMGHPVLREVAHPIPPDHVQDPEIQRLIHDMVATLVECDGAGLAAPQVHQGVRLVVVAGDEGTAPLVLVNPELTWLTDDRVRSWEGCLSVPGVRGQVERVAGVRVDALNEAGERVSYDLSGFPAVVVQHECDHLDGVLYVERCDLRTLSFMDELRRFGLASPPGDADEGSAEEDAESGSASDPGNTGAMGRQAVERLISTRSRPAERVPTPVRGTRLLRGRAVLQEN
ncbi:MAG: peptide deformylase [Deltaproteobacteria bacterium]|nr:peptide deformylase [Deltaproteobacteria bacterium]